MTEFRSIYMPYCLILNENGKYTITNRNYKPLGFDSGFFNYEEYAREITGLTPRIISQLSWDNNPDHQRIYLYNDGCTLTANKSAMDSYLKKIAILASLKIK